MQMNIFKRIIRFYSEGFKGQSRVSRRLWLIIFIKLFIMFAILRVFLFKDYLDSKDMNKEEKSQYIIENLTNNNGSD